MPCGPLRLRVGTRQIALLVFLLFPLVLLFPVGAPPEGERAARDRAARRRFRSSLGSLSSRLVAPVTFRRYRKAFLSFTSFARQAWHVLPDSPSILDECLCTYIDTLWQEGFPQSDAIYAVSGVAFFVPSVRFPCPGHGNFFVHGNGPSFPLAPFLFHPYIFSPWPVLPSRGATSV